MINIEKILKRSWYILWNLRALWIFGIILALTAGSSGGGSSGSGLRYNFNYNPNGNNPNFQPGPFLHGWNDWFNQNINPLFDQPGQHVSTLIWIGIAFVLFIILILVVTALIRYPSETAVLRMVDEYEQSGTKAGFKQGWKLGWNRRALRIWVIDLVVSIPVVLFIALLIGLGLAVFFSVRNGNEALAVAGTLGAIGCAFVFILAFLVLMGLVGLLRQFFVRAAALDGSGVGESFRNGWVLFKHNWKSAGLMWLVMLAIGIGSGIAGGILFFLLIPLYLVLALPAALVAVVPVAIAFGITSIFASGPPATIAALVVGIPLFLLVTLAPLTLVRGWYMIYKSSAWTLTYREIKNLESTRADIAPIKD